MDVYQKLKELGLTLPEAPAKGGVYTPCKLTEDGYAYISGCGPCMADETISGKLGKEFDVAQGQKLAESCMLNVLAVLEKKIGNLNRVPIWSSSSCLWQARTISIRSRRWPTAQAICLLRSMATISMRRPDRRSV